MRNWRSFCKTLDAPNSCGVPGRLYVRPEVILCVFTPVFFRMMALCFSLSVWRRRGDADRRAGVRIGVWCVPQRASPTSIAFASFRVFANRDQALNMWRLQTQAAEWMRFAMANPRHLL